MNWLSQLIRSDLRDFAAYRSARTEGANAASIELDANESPWPPLGRLASEDSYHRYPAPQPPVLRERLSQIYGVAPECVLLGRGSDESIDLLLRLFCRAGTDQILTCPPTFGMYEVAANLQGAETLRVLLREGQLDMSGIAAACTARTKLIFIPSPNAPMGHLMETADIVALCERRAGQGLVVIDEAYVEFTARPEGLLPFLARLPNLVVLRTLSKAYALAGERVGCAIAAPEIIRALQNIMAPYPLPRSSIRAALDALTPNGLITGEERRRLLVAERRRMAAALADSPLVDHVYPSDANFLLLRSSDADALMERLRRMGIRARNRTADIPGAVRISIGTPDQNDAVLACLGCTGRAPRDEASRMHSVRRQTKETDVEVTVMLDRPNILSIDTGIGFFDHMLMQIASHGGFGLSLQCRGDLHIDQHHSVEDCALALGAAISGALGDKAGIARFGFTAPLDEALADVAIDLSGRPYFAFTGSFPAEFVGGLNTEMVPHFFRSFSTSLNAAIHLKVTGENSHHMVEASFKAAGRALRQALRLEGRGVPSTKGVL
jgi:histidinol-phosphate aminotransferase/imidazoleglycerol-phosphate dehydratase/histidinol-phosphatase